MTNNSVITLNKPEQNNPLWELIKEGVLGANIKHGVQRFKRRSVFGPQFVYVFASNTFFYTNYRTPEDRVGQISPVVRRKLTISVLTWS
jgi:hypothetical protein